MDERGGESYRAGQSAVRLGDRLAERQQPVPRRTLRPSVSELDDDADEGQFLRSKTRIKVRRGVVPESLWGRILAGVLLVVVATGLVWGAVMVHRFFLHDPRFFIDTAEEIQIDGNTHVSRAQLLNIFGEDVGRNLFRVPLEERRADLEALPWVERATVMRLLPNRLRVRVVERRPVAFVREGGRIGLVDANGVLLGLPTGDSGGEHYSFPVLTGVDAAEPLTTRAARMKIYLGFIKDVDAGGAKVSDTLSEVDISDPDDVKAVIPEQGSEVMVHFGSEDFLARYQRFEQQLPVWRAQYPNLYSVDMRYANQVVLDMLPGTGGTVSVQPASDTAATQGTAGQAAPASAASAQTVVPAAVQATVVKPQATVAPKPPPVPTVKPQAVTKKVATPTAPAVKSESAPVAKAGAVTKYKPPKTVKPKTAAGKSATAKMAAPIAPVQNTRPAVVTPEAAQAASIRAANEAAIHSAAHPKAENGAGKPVTSTSESAQAAKDYSVDHPLMQAYDVPVKKVAGKKPSAAKKTTARAKPATKKASVVKSKQQTAAQQ